MSTVKFYQSVIHATWMNAKRKPFDDPRIRRAMHLLLEKQVLVDVVKDHPADPTWTGSKSGISNAPTASPRIDRQGTPTTCCLSPAISLYH